jgi:DNA-binding LacI/PurR family transcriptional regulator
MPLIVSTTLPEYGNLWCFGALYDIFINMAQQKFRTIASKLEKDIRKQSDPVLPSIEALSHRYEVSYQTMMKAMHALREKGVVAFRSGRWVLLTGSKAGKAQTAEAESAHHKLYCLIKSRIADGIYKAGLKLPKFDYFVINERVSKHTVQRAFVLLEKENLIHKQGKQWQAGPSRPRAASRPAGIAANQPTILLVFFSETWMRPFFNSFIAPFSTTFSRELMGYGFQPFLTAQNIITSRDLSSEEGFSHIQSIISSLGRQYKGALVYSFADEGDLDRWLPFLQSFSKPVAYFDSTNEGERFVRGNFGLKEKYHRLFLDEHAAVSLALNTLTQAGHTKIGMPDIHHETAEWAKRRIKIAQQIAGGMTPSVKIITSKNQESFWQFLDGARSKPFAYRLGKTLSLKRSKKRKPREILFSRTPSMAKLLDKGATALLAVNDNAALEYYLWLKEAGFDVPRDISLLSFDNRPDMLGQPLSTIDFGFQRLGYLAAHIFIGDLPVRAAGNGNIGGPCTLVNRGSITDKTH